MYTEFAVIVGHPGGQPSVRGADAAERARGIDRSVEEAAFNLGAGPLTMARRVLLPLALPGFAAGAIFCFILTMNRLRHPGAAGRPAVRDDGPAGLCRSSRPRATGRSAPRCRSS
jgi:putative spermidine/putrescine transport system permease protein